MRQTEPMIEEDQTTNDVNDRRVQPVAMSAEKDVAEIVRRHSAEIRQALDNLTLVLDAQA